MSPRPDADGPWLDEAFVRLRASGDTALRDEIAQETEIIALRCARRFTGRGEPFDDLLQVARMGLLKAIDRFDPSHGVPFGAFATPTIVGELRRHFRDHTWAVHVTRGAKDLRGPVNSAVDELTARLGRSPLVQELATHLGMRPETVIEVLEANHAYRPATLDPGNPHHDEQRRGASDEALDRTHVQALLAHLPERERTILYLRFFEERSQAEIAERLGTSQVHVGRLIAASLTALRRLDTTVNREE